MKQRTLTELAEATGGRLVPAGSSADGLVGPDVVIDTRLAGPGSVFVALPGERVDGHDFVDRALAAGSAAALVTREVDVAIDQVVVADGVQGLTGLATDVISNAHAAGSLRVVAITGSSGKTSTKDIVAQLLETAGETVSPMGSFNNEIGVPLTACRVGESTRFLVSEMGARGVGHIAWLCSIVRPDVSMVLNVGSAHLGEFGSVEAIARAKGEIVENLGEDGWAVLNLDDARVAAMAQRTRARVAWFSVTDAAAPQDAELVVRARDLHPDDLQQYSFTLVVERAGAEPRTDAISLPLIGRHQVANAVAAVAAALAAGVELNDIVAALPRLAHRSAMRMELVVRADGAAIINDCYNANPDSMRAALDALAPLGAARRQAHPSARVLAVLGDMLELGPETEALHEAIGEYAVGAGADEVIALGDHAPALVRGATGAGGSGRVASVEEAGSLVLARGDVVLVKASRGLALERVVAALLEQASDADATPAVSTAPKDQHVNEIPRPQQPAEETRG